MALKAMILAAGRGERMRPLTDICPKPLLEVAGQPLIVHLITRLASAGYRDIVINHAHLGSRIVDVLGDGSAWSVSIQYSAEGERGLETGGGIYRALELLNTDPFLVVNGDIWTDYPFEQLTIRDNDLAHLVLVDNPPQHLQGDFALHDSRVNDSGEARLTYSGIALLRHELFAACVPGSFPLAPLLRMAMGGDRVGGEYYAGQWQDIGTPGRLEALNDFLAKKSF